MIIELVLDQPGELSVIAEHQPVEFVYAAAANAHLALSIDGIVLDPFLRPSETTWRWRWNPGPAVGLHQLVLNDIGPDAAATRWTWALRVITRKVDQERYQALLEDIQRAAYGVLATLAGASAEGAELQREAPWQHSPAEEYYALLEERLESFARAVRRIAARPREQLRGAFEQLPLGQASELGARALSELARGPFDAATPAAAPDLQAALRTGGGLLPRDVTAERDRPTTDIYEHRLLKHLLGMLARRARFVGSLAERDAARLAGNEAFTGPNMRRLRAQQIATGSAAATQMLRELRGLSFLAEVQPMPSFRGATPLLQRDAAYREVYRMWQALRQHPYVTFDSPLFGIPIADLPHLYESWCAIQVARALLELGGTVREQRLVEQRRSASTEDDLEYTVVLADQAPLLVIEHGALTVVLRYQPRYRPLTNDERRATNDNAGLNPASSIVRRSSGKLGSLD
ncbi:MAG: restriction endonuclease-like protein, partial [Chloroflexota bacterium]|nr:restriction endonuclease-like protein [Chloroflexota bacterium]